MDKTFSAKHILHTSSSMFQSFAEHFSQSSLLQLPACSTLLALTCLRLTRFGINVLGVIAVVMNIAHLALQRWQNFFARTPFGRQPSSLPASA